MSERLAPIIDLQEQSGVNSHSDSVEQDHMAEVIDFGERVLQLLFDAQKKSGSSDRARQRFEYLADHHNRIIANKDKR